VLLIKNSKGQIQGAKLNRLVRKEKKRGKEKRSAIFVIRQTERE
jgi:hypothetical protein